jgi:hypothetical protein
MSGALTTAIGGAAAASAATYGWFVAVDRLSLNPGFRAALAEYLKTSPTSGDITNTALRLFTAAFGERHFSWKCIKRSFLISILANLCSCVLVILLNPQTSLLSNDDGNIVVPVVLGWVLVAAIPDYINLYKTRMVLNLLDRFKTLTSKVLLMTLLLDFLVGLLLFSAIFGTVEGILGSYFYNDIVPSMSDLLSGVLGENLSHLLWLISNGDYQAGFFFVSMLPSAWLWTSIGAMLLGRAWMGADPEVTLFRKIFDVEKSPIQSLGAITAGLVFVGVASLSIIIILVSRVETLSVSLN